MTERAKWRFVYSGATIAKKKAAFHKGRLTFWIDKKQEVLTKVRETGIEVDESIASESPKFSASNYGRDPVVSIKAELVRDLGECAGKIKEHRTKLDAYAGWEQVLRANAVQSHELDHDDWLFFFGEPVDLGETADV